MNEHIAESVVLKKLLAAEVIVLNPDGYLCGETLLDGSTVIELTPEEFEMLRLIDGSGGHTETLGNSAPTGAAS